MILKTVSAQNFRNYDLFRIFLSPKINIIYGNNGQGKTNILESIYYLAITKSHRNNNDMALIKKNNNFFKIKGIVEKEKNTYDLKIENLNGIKKIYIDNNLKKTTEYLSNLIVVIFYPDDLNLIKGSPAERRRYLNINLFQSSKNYVNNLSEYNKILKIRNELLKQKNKKIKIDENYFNIITDSFIKKYILIYKERKNYFEEINKIIPKVFNDLSGMKNFKIRYIPSLKINDDNIIATKEILEKLNKISDIEIKYGSTLIGPHRDDYIFELNELDLKKYGSQGQQRMSIIALKLAEIELYKKTTRTSPILLLDDVFSELDDDKKNNLLKYLDGNIQTVITTTELSSINENILKNSKIFRVDNGNIEEIGKV